MSKKMKRTLGIVQTVLLVVLVFTGLAAAVVVGMPRVLAASNQRVSVFAVPAGAVGLLGLEADALTAVGLHSAQAATVINDLTDYLEENGAAFSTAIVAARDAGTESDNIDRQVRAGKGPATEVVNAARSAADQKSAARQQALAAAFAAATESLTEAQRQALQTIKANRDRNVPVQYLLVDRTDAEWLTLRDSLSAKRRSDALNEPVPAAVTDAIATADADTRVATAAGHLATRGAEVTAMVRNLLTASLPQPNP